MDPKPATLENLIARLENNLALAEHTREDGGFISFASHRRIVALHELWILNDLKEIQNFAPAIAADKEGYC